MGGARFSSWGPCARCLLSRTPQPVYRPPPSVLLQNNIYCFGPCCSWCGWPQAPGEAGVEQGQPHLHLPNVSCSPNSQRPWCFRWVPTCAAELPLAMALAGHAPRPRAACFVLVGSWFSPRGPGLLWAMTGACPHPTANSQPQEQHFLSQSFCGMSDPRPWKVARVALDVDAAPAGWCLLT